MYCEPVHEGSKLTLTMLYPIAFNSMSRSSMFVADSPGNTTEGVDVGGCCTPPPTAASSSLIPPHPIRTGTEVVPALGSTVSVWGVETVLAALSVTVNEIVEVPLVNDWDTGFRVLLVPRR